MKWCLYAVLFQKTEKSIKEESNFISSIKTNKLLILFQHQQSLYDDLIVEFLF